jgi:amino acid adenylation domain-containing protein
LDRSLKSYRTAAKFEHDFACRLHTDSADVERAIAFAALFVISRQLGRSTVRVRAVNAMGREQVFSADFEAGAKLSQAYSALRAVDDPDTDRPDLLLRAEGKGGDRDGLVLDYSAAGDRLKLVLDIGDRQVAATTATDFLEKMEAALRALTQQPETVCDKVELIGPTARAMLPDLSRPIPTRYHEPAAVTFMTVAARQPSAPAISSEGRQYTYGQLAGAAMALSRQLHEAGLRPGEVVAIAGPSCFGTIAALLAILAAGGVVVTLDPALPGERRDLIQRISGATKRIEVDLDGSVSTGGEVIRVAAWPDPSTIPSGHVDQPLEAERLLELDAYIFFTSGSTGTPKGVLGTQLGLAHFLEWQRRSFPLGPGDNASQITALSFDVVLRDILFPLTSGACLHIPARERILDADAMLDWLEEKRISSMHCVPSLMKAWLQASRTGRTGHTLGALRYLFFAGEPLTDALLQRVKALAGPNTSIVNLYGPTETTLAKLANVVDTIEPGVQPVGRPQPGVDVAIMRDRASLCGLWETGEIVIRTPYRSHGYVNAPELTRQVFVPNPFRDDPEDLLYFTGDLGRLRPDGKVEIFGRIDTQVKINGVRIEPNEIEGEILKHPAVKDAAIAVRPDGQGDKALVALLVLNGSQDTGAVIAEVRTGLAQRLHPAMIPGRFVVLDALPYLPNGKLDRKAIAAMDFPSDGGGESGAGLDGADPRMRALVRRLETTLNMRIDSLDHSFIALGGNSLSYIVASSSVSGMLGYLPKQWERRPLRELGELLGDPADAKPEPPFWAPVDTTVVFRVLAIMLVVVSHTEAFRYIAATSVLFVISGMNFGRFLRPRIQATGSIKPVIRMILEFGIPAGLWQALRSVVFHSWWLPDLVLLGTVFQNPAAPHYTFWFLDVLAANLLVLALFEKAVHAVRQREGVSHAPPADTFGRDLALLGVFVLIAMVQVGFGLWDGQVGESSVAPFKWGWLLALGLVAASATTRERKLVVTLILIAVFATVLVEYPVLSRGLAYVDLFFLVCTLVLVWTERLPMPRLLVRPMIVIASATLFIYIVNFSVINHIMPRLGLPAWWPLQLLLAVTAGICGKFVWDVVSARVIGVAQDLLGRAGSPQSRPHSQRAAPEIRESAK